MIRGGFLVVRLNIKKHGNAHTYYFLLLSFLGGGFEVGNGSQIEENPAKMDMLSPSWAVLGDLGCKLGCLGRFWLQVGLSWEMLGARWSAMEQPGAPRGATRGSPTGSTRGVSGK